MPTPAKFPRLAVAALGVLVCLLALRYVATIESGISHGTAIRTYVFWAVVTIPVARLADVLGRTVMSYRFVKLALARVQSDSRG